MPWCHMMVVSDHPEEQEQEDKYQHVVFVLMNETEM